jgi:hypothetical protein
MPIFAARIGREVAQVDPIEFAFAVAVAGALAQLLFCDTDDADG